MGFRLQPKNILRINDVPYREKTT